MWENFKEPRNRNWNQLRAQRLSYETIQKRLEFFQGMVSGKEQQMIKDINNKQEIRNLKKSEINFMTSMKPKDVYLIHIKCERM